MNSTYPHLPVNLLFIAGNQFHLTSTWLEGLKSSFQKYNWYTMSVGLMTIHEDLVRVNDFIKAHNIRFIIAYGKEAIFALAITNSIAKIVINPCLYPHTETYNMSESQVNALKRVEESTYSNVDGEMRCCTYGIFIGKDLPSLSFDKFNTIYGNSNHTFIKTATKRTMQESILKGLGNGVTYFQKLACQLSNPNICIY